MVVKWLQVNDVNNQYHEELLKNQEVENIIEDASADNETSFSEEAINEVKLDINEGADVIIIKPAISYLDIIYRIKQKFNVPIIAYNVSGEYTMVKSASEKNFINGIETILEILHSIKRSGANAIISYHALEVAKYLKANDL